MSSELPYPTGTLRQVHDRGDVWVEDDAGRLHELCSQCRTWIPADLLPNHLMTHPEYD